MSPHPFRSNYTLLEPLATKQAELTRYIEAHVAALSDKDLHRLRRYVENVSSTNCWWASHDVAPAVRDAIGRRLYSENQQRKATASTPAPPPQEIP